MQPQPRNRRNSLQGLQQFNPGDYGRGKRVRNATTSHQGVNVAECTETALVVEDNDSLEPGGVEIDVIETEWFQRELSHAMVAYSEDEPTLKAALGGHEKESWWNAMEMELSQIEKLHTWDLVEPPPNANIIPSMYVFRWKRNDQGYIVRHRARIVAKGCGQQFGIDYNETFTPTVRPATLCIMLSLGAQKNASIHQVDVKSAYLNAHLDENEKLYMALPPLYLDFRHLPRGLEKA